MLQRLVLFTVFTFLTGIVFAVPLESLVSPAHAVQLRSSDELIIETQLRNPAPRIIPQNNELRRFVNGIKDALNPGMMVEVMYLYKKPASFHTSVNIWDEAQKIQIFNQLMAISSLAGTQYYSSTRSSMRTFYESSAVIDNPTARNPLPDPVFTQLPQTLTLYANQKDLTFGENIYRYDCVNTPEAIFFVQENVTAMTYGVIPAIGRGNLRSIVSVIDCGDSILVYAASMARAASIPGMGDRIGNSFNNRAKAVLNWLTFRLNREVFAG